MASAESGAPSAIGVAEPACLERPICSVPTEDVGPLLFGGIRDQSRAGSLHLSCCGVNLVLGEIGGRKPDQQWRIIGRNPFAQLEEIAGRHFRASRADDLRRRSRQAIQAGDAKLNQFVRRYWARPR